MRSNADKWHLLVSTNNTVNIKLGSVNFTNTNFEKLLGVKFEYKLTFNKHTSELCKRSGRKIHALARVLSYMNILKKHIL